MTDAFHSVCSVCVLYPSYILMSDLGQLYPSLCELAHVLSVDGPVKQRLDHLAAELTKAADKELQVCVFCCRSCVKMTQNFQTKWNSLIQG